MWTLQRDYDTVNLVRSTPSRWILREDDRTVGVFYDSESAMNEYARILRERELDAMRAVVLGH